VIDAPAFNWRVARQMRKRGIPVVYYVCPQFWAWRQGRVKLLRKYINQAMVIFPFEENFYRVHGVNATFVGHPLADLPTPEISRMHYAAQQALDHVKPWITLMPAAMQKLGGICRRFRAAARFDEYEFLCRSRRGRLVKSDGNRDIHLGSCPPSTIFAGITPCTPMGSADGNAVRDGVMRSPSPICWAKPRVGYNPIQLR
jgi:hypothetical protein